jgi:lysophospholipase L1-like esterase
MPVLSRRPGRFTLLAAVLATLVLAPAAAARETAIVAMGDSEISGEGAGSYVPRTNGPSDYCHRSAKAWIMVTPIAVDRKVNLACSGARSANLRPGGPGQYGEPSQGARLRAIAAAAQVKAIFVTVGANDHPRFGRTAERCVSAFVFQTGLGCARIDGPTWSQRVLDMQAEVLRALAGIRRIMDEAHYARGAYQLVVVSYASPTPASMRYADGNYWGKVLNGCPLYAEDAAWGHDLATPALDRGKRTVAARAGVRFLDMVEAFEGHEVCADGITARRQWIRGVTYDPLSSTWWSSHAVQQSLHPNARGHARLAGCAAEFFAQTRREGSCEIEDGAVHAVPHG